MTVTLAQFLEAMDQAVDTQKEEKANLENYVWTSCSEGWQMSVLQFMYYYFVAFKTTDR